MGMEQQCVILDNAHSSSIKDCLAYDLCPSCCMLPHTQEFSISMGNIDILIFLITKVLKNNDIQHMVCNTDHWATVLLLESPKWQEIIAQAQELAD